MIINACISLIVSLLSGLFSALSFLPIPNGVNSAFATGLGWIAQGLKLVAAYTHFSYLLSLFVFVAAIDAAMFLYKIIMWALRKIPFWSVK